MKDRGREETKRKMDKTHQNMTTPDTGAKKIQNVMSQTIGEMETDNQLEEQANILQTSKHGDSGGGSGGDTRN